MIVVEVHMIVTRFAKVAKIILIVNLNLAIKSLIYVKTINIIAINNVKFRIAKINVNMNLTI